MKKLLPFAVFVIGILFSFFYYHNLNIIKEKLNNDNTEYTFNLLENDLDSIIRNRFFVSEAMKSFIKINHEFSAQDFKDFAETLLSANPPIRAIQYADPETRVTYVYPAVGNEITIKDPMVLISDPKRGKYVKKAISEKTATLQPPFTLRQGGIGMILRNPIFIGDAFSGLSIIVLDVDKIIEEVYSISDFSNYKIGYYTEDGKFFFGSDLYSEESISRRIAVADTFWEIRIAATDSSADLQQYILPLLILMVFTGIAVIIFLIMNRQEYLKKQIDIETSRLRENNIELNNQIELRRRSELQARELLSEKELLLKEIHHRLKNNLNSIRSLLYLKADEARDPATRGYLTTTIARIDSLKELYERLLETENYLHLKTRNYLHKLIESIKMSLGDCENIDFRVDIDDFELDTRILFPIGIITNELITNAVKYAFPDNHRGIISINLKNQQDSFLYEISDNGEGSTPSEDSKNGFGLSLLRMLIEQLNGRLEESFSYGYMYKIYVPLEGNKK